MNLFSDPKKQKVLYITYDGLLDPLGSSQILPYIMLLNSPDRRFHILSFEKRNRLIQGSDQLQKILTNNDVDWTPLNFTSRFGFIGKIFDLFRMLVVSIYLQINFKFSIVHSRSYPAMQVACILKKIFKVSTIFDMRGLWVDERVEGGIWNLDSLIGRFIFNLYKNFEKSLLSCADQIIVLTQRVVPELHLITSDIVAPVTVIPCCADFNHFKIVSASIIQDRRMAFGFQDTDRVISYLGSLGTWYMLKEMLLFFKVAQIRWGNVYFLIITNDKNRNIDDFLDEIDMRDFRSRIQVISCDRIEVPIYLSCSNLMVSFIRPSYSKIASSPTKLAEAFALGIPVISNYGIGDVDKLTIDVDGGALVELENPVSIFKTVELLDYVIKKGGPLLRERSKAVLSLDVAKVAYNNVYSDLSKKD